MNLSIAAINFQYCIKQGTRGLKYTHNYRKNILVLKTFSSLFLVEIFVNDVQHVVNEIASLFP